MRAVIQRVSRAGVSVADKQIANIGRGLVVLLGVEQGDSEQDSIQLAQKTPQLRIFADQAGKMNLSLVDVGGEALVVSQFTLLGDARKGRRPSFVRAADAELGNRLYEHFVQQLGLSGVGVETGQFQADMQVEMVNDGPVTILLDSHRIF